ncbi:MAG: LysR family transcriptional regulator [Myxococcales bacterium]|nr:MAG: LysR family transcriptional regulator [Myxococcales bacterium]
MHHPAVETIDLSDVQLFVAVARAASFVGASRKTGVPTSTVSRAIARLEESLGKRLLHRTSRRVSLTQEGAWLLERTASLMEELDVAVADLRARETVPSGTLRVTAPLMTGAEHIAPALLSFAAAHPRVRLQLELTNAVLALREEGLDLAFRAGPVVEADVIARKLWEAPFALAASPAFVKKALGGRSRVSAEQLAELPAVVARPGATWKLRGADGTVSELQPRERVAVSDPRVAVAAAQAGLGVVRAPLALVRRKGSGLVRLQCELGEPEPRALFVVYPSRRLLPLRVRAAIDWVAKRLPS